MRRYGILPVLVLSSMIAPVRAQEPHPFMLDSVRARHYADSISTGLVISAIGANTLSCGIENRNAQARWRCWGREACSVGIATGIMLAAKALVPRLRPDGSNHRSFFSGHTAQAGAAQNWNREAGWAFAISTGIGRMTAGKHHLSDVIVGLFDGWGSVWACNQLLPQAPVETRRTSIFGE
jgi:PAP2 superfamily